MTNTVLTLAAIALVGCTTERAAAPTALVGTGDPITGNWSAFCQDKVAGILGTQPQYVKTGSPIIGADGSITIDGTVSKGDEGIKSFRCRYDASGRFIDVIDLITTTSDGALIVSPSASFVAMCSFSRQDRSTGVSTLSSRVMFA